MPDFNQYNDPLNIKHQPVSTADPGMYSRHVSIGKGIVKSVRDLTYDTRELVVQCDVGSILHAHAGQYAALQPDSLEMARAYSLARAPECEKPGEHTFFVRLLKDGKFSNWVSADKVGESLMISGPLGKFGLDPSDRPMLCIAGGSGMSAIFAILEHAVTQQVDRDAYFFYGARAQKDMYMAEEIAGFIKRWNPKRTLRFIPVLSDEPEDSNWEGARGFVTEYMKKEYLETDKIDPKACVAYFCGPPPMIDAGIVVLKDLGMKGDDILYDKFEDLSSPVPVVDNSMCVLCDECLMTCPISECILEVSKLSKNSEDDFTYEKIIPEKTSGLYYNSLYINPKRCIRCYACVDACPADAISPTYSNTPNTLRDITG